MHEQIGCPQELAIAPFFVQRKSQSQGQGLPDLVKSWVETGDDGTEK